MQIEVTHEILTNNHLRIYGDDEIIVDKPFVYIFAEDSPCALTLKIDNLILRDAANDAEVGRIVADETKP
jgi:hypothetical protein